VRLLLDITHPAHLHFFRNLVSRLRREGHQVYLAGRHKDILLELAAGYGLELDAFGRARPGLFSLGREMLQRQARLLGIIRRFRPDAMMAIAGTFIAPLGWLTRTPTYVFYDSEHATVSNLLSYPFATCVYVPRCYLGSIRWRHERYNGYHELAYLHADTFIPDPAVVAEAGLAPGETFTLVRFVGWAAGHDIGKEGLSLEQKVDAVRRLARHGRVLISTEGELPAELEPMRLRLSVTRIHDLMAHASLIFGEGATMMSEAAVLGVPSVYVNPLTAGTLEEQEREYGILFGFRPADFEAAVVRAEAILAAPDREGWRAIGQRIAREKIDVTEMLYRVATERPYAS
jgi:predicted glycosyltransferase